MNICDKIPADSLPNDVNILKQIIFDLSAEYEKLRHKLEMQDQLIMYFRRHQFGRRSERLQPGQLVFEDFVRVIEVKENEAKPQRMPASPSPHNKNGHGRRMVPHDIPWNVITLDVPEEQRSCRCCNKQMKFIGEDISNQVEYKPASVYVNHYVIKKYACGDCQEGVLTHPLPPRPIPRGEAGPGLLAYIIVSKFSDHLPLYRLEEIIARSGLEISRSTMVGWQSACAELLKPVYEAMKKDILSSKKISTDDTPVKVLDPSLDHTRTGRLWAYLGDRDHNHTVFEYTRTRGAEHPQNFLKDFSGPVQADASSGYDEMFRELDRLGGRPRKKEAGCWAHARRYFFDAVDDKPERRLTALAFIAQLYIIEDQIRQFSPKRKRKFRRKFARPILKEFRKWLEKQYLEALPQSGIGKAIHYTLAQWTALNEYVNNGRLDIDNNAVERVLRRPAIGRKNWLFFGSDAGGERAAIFYSLIASCKQNGVDPFEYLRDVLIRILTHPQDKIDELMPSNWKRLFREPDTS